MGRRSSGWDVGLQDGESRDSASFNNLPPLVSPLCASSPISSTTDAASSALPGGWTGLLASMSLSASKPCRGARGSPSFAALGFAFAALGFAFAALGFALAFGALCFGLAFVAALLRAAFLRAEER